MSDRRKIKNFEWDEGNINKSYQKHGITPNEAEEVFLDQDILISESIKYAETEKRFEAIGRITKGDILFLAFTIRGNKIRIISARKANIKERIKYEQKI